MDACNIILVSTDVLLLSIGVGPSIWGTKTTEFASDKKKVFDIFFYIEKAICFSKRISDRKFFRKFFVNLEAVSYFQDAEMLLFHSCGKLQNSAASFTFLVSRTRFLKNSNNISDWRNRWLNIFTFLGYCCIIYMQCSTAAFRINTSTAAGYTKAQIGSNCPEDYIGIEGVENIFSIFHLQYFSYDFLFCLFLKLPLNLELAIQTAFIVEDFWMTYQKLQQMLKLEVISNLNVWLLTTIKIIHIF